jgi:5-formyltetrahydrofolate cyclo-ligase
MSTSDKHQIRALLRQRRRLLDPAQRQRQQLAAAELVTALPAWKRAQHVALYLAADGEFDPTAIARRCRAEGRQLYLPVILPDRSLLFALWEEAAELTPNRLGIPEPPASARRVQGTALDLILLPLVGWCRNGTRLGMGGGYYDRSLSGKRGPDLVGLGFAFQEVEALPADAWDVPLDYVISGRELWRVGAAPALVSRR